VIRTLVSDVEPFTNPIDRGHVREFQLSSHLHSRRAGGHRHGHSRCCDHHSRWRRPQSSLGESRTFVAWLR